VKILNLYNFIVVESKCMKLLQRSIHFGNLFVAVGNAEINKRWRRIRRIRESLLSKPYTVLVVLALLWRDSIEIFLFELHHRDTVYQIVKQFEGTGSVCHKRAKGRRSRASVRTEEVVGAAWEAITGSPKKSVRRIEQDIGVPTSTAWQI
jgi:hypothetical protein